MSTECRSLLSPFLSQQPREEDLTTSQHPCHTRTSWPESLRRQTSRWSDAHSILHSHVEKRWCVGCKTDTFYNSNVIETSVETTAKTKGLMMNKYHNLEESYHVQPVAIETSGAWGSATTTFIKQLRRKLTETTGDPREAGDFSIPITSSRQRCCYSGMPPTMYFTLILFFKLFAVSPFCTAHLSNFYWILAHNKHPYYSTDTYA